jgi:hypothetical protein
LSSVRASLPITHPHGPSQPADTSESTPSAVYLRPCHPSLRRPGCHFIGLQLIDTLNVRTFIIGANSRPEGRRSRLTDGISRNRQRRCVVCRRSFAVVGIRTFEMGKAFRYVPRGSLMSLAICPTTPIDIVIAICRRTLVSTIGPQISNESERRTVPLYMIFSPSTSKSLDVRLSRICGGPPAQVAPVTNGMLTPVIELRECPCSAAL